MEIKKLGIVGCGLMGAGIAQVSADSGYETVVHEVDDEILAKGLNAIKHFLSRSVKKGTLTEERKTEVLGRIRGTTRLEDLQSSDLIVEAIVENLQAKTDLYRALDDIVGPDAIFASNTSSLCITQMAANTRRPARFVGLHFFNPVPRMKVVEIVATIMTEPEVLELVTGFARSLGKTPIRSADRPGFVVNRLLVPFLLDSIRALEEGVGTKEDIDTGMKLGCGHPMGPLELMDFVGLDTTFYIANIMYDEFREKRFAPPPLLRRMVMAGLLGRKSGKGFYDYA
jgi:3-hydroxybutyryl-CoA dehydrogenase